MIILYGFKDCEPCKDAERWMNKNGVKFTQKGVTPGIDEYPTIEVNGHRLVGFGDAVKHMIMDAVKT